MSKPTKRGKVYNRIFDEEEWKLVNQVNIDIMEDFLEEYTQRKKKPSTISQYRYDLRIVFLYIKRKLKNRSILELTRKDFRSFSIWLSDELGVSSSRSNRLMSSVRSLLTFVEDDDDYDYENNVAKKVRGLPNVPVRTDEDNFFLTYDQVTRLRDELIKRGRLQHAVMLMVFFDSGARRNEVLQVEKHGLTEGNRTNVVIGKRGKAFPLVYMNDTRELIKRYLDERGEDNVDLLWTIGSGENIRPATYESIYERVVSMSAVLSEIEGREIQFFPHSLRHSRAECLIRGEDPRIIDPITKKPKVFSLEEVQTLLNHSDPKTTQGYMKDRTDEIIDGMFNFD